jgi:hypothetical protein
MPNGTDVMFMLRPNGGWYIQGDDFDTLIYENCEPVTKEEFETGFVDYLTWKAEQDSAKAAQKAALLNRLGITEDEAKLLLA